jgi:acetoacetate decarboxylase
MLCLNAHISQHFWLTFHLSKELVTIDQQSIEIGEAKVILNESKHDPWVEIEVVEVLGAIYTVSNNVM